MLDISGQPIFSIFKGQTPQENNYQHMLHNNAKEWEAGRKYSLFNQSIKNMKQQYVFLT